MLSAQVTVHLKGKTECFECQPKAAPKSFPVSAIAIYGFDWLRACHPGHCGALLIAGPQFRILSRWWSACLLLTAAANASCARVCCFLLLPGLHHPQHARQADPLRGLGQGPAVPTPLWQVKRPKITFPCVGSTCSLLLCKLQV